MNSILFLGLCSDLPTPINIGLLSHPPNQPPTQRIPAFLPDGKASRSIEVTIHFQTLVLLRKQTARPLQRASIIVVWETNRWTAVDVSIIVV